MGAEATVYMIDTCSLTEMRRRYPREHFEPAWRLIERLVDEGRLLSVDEVYEELKAQDDELNDWADKRKEIFLPLTEEVQREARAILKRFPNLVDLKKKKSGADPFLIAAAIVRGATVVTEEKKSGGPPSMKIPDVCTALEVPCVQLLSIFKVEGLK